MFFLCIFLARIPAGNPLVAKHDTVSTVTQVFSETEIGSQQNAHGDVAGVTESSGREQQSKQIQRSIDCWLDAMLLGVTMR